MVCAQQANLSECEAKNLLKWYHFLAQVYFTIDYLNLV